MRRRRLIDARLHGVQGGAGGNHLLAIGAHPGLVGGQGLLGAVAILLAGDALLGQRDRALGVERLLAFVGFAFLQRGLGGLQSGGGVVDLRVGFAVRAGVAFAALAHLGTQPVQGGAGGVALGDQVGVVDLRDQTLPASRSGLRPPADARCVPATLLLTMTWLASTVPIRTTSEVPRVE